MATQATAASQQKLASEIAVYQAIPASKRTPKQSSALATDLSTYQKQQAVLGGGSTTATPVQLTPGIGAGFTGSGPVIGGGAAAGNDAGTLTGAAGSVASGGLSGTWLIVGGGALVLILLLHHK